MSDTRTGAQIQAHIQQMLKTVAELSEAMKLRQWAVDRAIEACKEAQFTSPETFIDTHVKLAAQLHAFAVQPALEAAAAIDSVKS